MMSFSEKLKDPRTCRIFFSSPFGGMEDEREELTRKYFPQIHHLCNQHGVQFVAVDMRWGITSEASASSQVINICLRELDRSDMFVGFFGQRYGWHGRNDDALQENFDNAVGTYSWLNDVRDKSVTELEFLHGHLNHPGQLPAVICFRDKSHDDEKRAEGERKGDKKQVFKYSPESEASVCLMDDLKQRCWKTKDKTLGVHLNYKDPAEGARLMFDAIWKHLTEVLIKDTDSQSQSSRGLRLAQHDAFLVSRLKMYGNMSENLKTLNQLVSSESPVGTLVVGDAGIGKSTLLCNWIKHVQSAYKSEVTVVYHFVGYGENSTAIIDILNQLCEELEYRCDIMSGMEDSHVQGGAKYNTSDDVRDLMQKLSIAVEKLLKHGKRTVIVIDGLDKVLKQTKTEKHLYWLPGSLPQGTVLVVATPSTDTETINELHDNRDYQLVTVTTLSEETQREFCVKTLQESGKELSPSQLDKIILAKQTENPLFLKIVLSELVVFGYFRLLDKKIDSLIECKSVDELCSNVLQRLEDDYNVKEHPANLVEQVMCTICLSRQGMSEVELIDMFSIPSHLWSPLYFAMEKYVINQSGCIQFGFREFKGAVEGKYFNNKNKKQLYWQHIADYFEKQKQRLPVLYKRNNMLKRVSHELPWAYLKLNNEEGLKSALTNLSVFTLLNDDCRFQLNHLWRETKCPWEDIADSYLKAVDLKVADLYLHVESLGLLSQNCPGHMVLPDVINIKDFIEKAGSFDATERICLQKIRMVEEIAKTKWKDELALEAARYDLACLYSSRGMHAKAEKLHRQVLEKRESRMKNSVEGSSADRESLGNSYHGLGVVYMHLTRYDEATELLHKSKELVEDTNQSFLGSCYTNLGLIQLYQGNYEECLEYSLKALQIEEDLYFGHLPLSIAYLLLNIGLAYRKQNKLDLARSYYQRSLEIKLNTIGEMHPDICISYINLAVLAELEGNNSEKCLEYYNKALTIYRYCKVPDVEVHYIRCWENQIKTLIEMVRMEEALESFMKFFEILEREQNLGNTVLIDGTIPFTHKEIVRYLMTQNRNDEARKFLVPFMKSKACHQSDYIFLDVLDNMEEVKPDRPDELTLDYAMKKWPDDGNMIHQKVHQYILPKGDTQQLIELIDKLRPVFEMGIYDAVNSWLGEYKPFNEDMFEQFNRAALKHYPDSAAFLSNLSGSLRRQKRHDEAIPYLQKVLELSPDNPHTHVELAQSALLQPNYDLDLARLHCMKVKDSFQDDKAKVAADQLLGFIVEIEEENKRKEETTENKESNVAEQNTSQ